MSFWYTSLCRKRPNTSSVNSTSKWPCSFATPNNSACMSV
eukprot:CAMPEP_0114308850 /NCGR_PEP_ID=MMETSP0059-20121206/18305_1 /TAXON_ID=36894 /ORGANISM="Pyramimonas parkeae, Strain CCMP726" /LENGTH=39 /DNA_ID= /DNA_START= /DNA_END= /DNA_ORIENTATION=